MAKGRNGSDSCFIFNEYFIDGIRYYLLQKLEENKDKSLDKIRNEHALNQGVAWRFEKTTPKSNDIKIDKVNIAKKHGDEAEWVDIPIKVVDIVQEMINEKMDNKEISEKIYIKLMKEGYMMENNKLVVKENNEIKEYSVILDNGNFNQKAKCGEKKITLSSRILIADLADLPGLEWIKLGNEKMYIGTEEGTYKNAYDKVEKSEELKGLILYTIDKVINSEEDVYSVNLGYLLPIQQTNKADKIRDTFEGKTFEFITQNGCKSMTINSVNILPEGYSSTGLFMEDENMIEFMENETLLLDMGSRTINVVSLEDGEIKNAKTLNNGSFHLYDLLHEESKKTKEKSVEQISKLYSKKDKLKVSDSIHIEYLNKIKNTLITYSEDLEDYDNIVLTGGVAKLLSTKTLEDGETTLLDKLIELLGVEKDNVHVLDNPTETNIDGAMILLNEMNKVA